MTAGAGLKLRQWLTEAKTCEDTIIESLSEGISARADEAEVEETLLTNVVQRQLSYRLAAVLEEGAARL